MGKDQGHNQINPPHTTQLFFVSMVAVPDKMNEMS